MRKPSVLGTALPSVLLVLSFIAALSMPAVAKTSLRFMVWSSYAKYEPVIAAFEKANPDIDVQIEPAVSFGQYISKIQVLFASDVAPDVMKLSGAFVGQLAKGGSLLDLKPLAEKDGVDLKNDYLPIGDVLRYKGKTYGLGTAYDIVGLLYNKSKFDKAGVAVPSNSWTWDDLRTAARKLTERNADEVTTYGFTLPAAVGGYGHEDWMGFFAQNGVRPLNESKTKANFNNSAAAETIEFMKSMYVEDRSVPTTREFSAFEFANEKLAMQTNVLPNPFKGLVGASFDWNVAPMTTKKQHATVANSVGFGINANSKVKEEAWRFLRFMVTEGEQILAANMSSLPTYKAAIPAYVKNDTVPSRFFDVLDISAPHAVDLQFTTTWRQWSTKLGEYIGSAVTGELPIESALESAEREINVILAEED